jgi:predicted DNA-binding protein (MmcQ/YjbR family)
MNIEEFRNYCLSKKGVTEGFPFNETTIVFKVGGKMFALANIEAFEKINLKCAPDIAIELREEYEAVKEGYHMNKKHWNTIHVNKDAPKELLKKWIDWSYTLVLNSLSAKIKAQIFE